MAMMTCTKTYLQHREHAVILTTEETAREVMYQGKEICLHKVVAHLSGEAVEVTATEVETLKGATIKTEVAEVMQTRNDQDIEGIETRVPWTTTTQEQEAKNVTNVEIADAEVINSSSKTTITTVDQATTESSERFDVNLMLHAAVEDFKWNSSQHRYG